MNPLVVYLARPTNGLIRLQNLLCSNYSSFLPRIVAALQLPKKRIVAAALDFSMFPILGTNPCLSAVQIIGNWDCFLAIIYWNIQQSC